MPGKVFFDMSVSLDGFVAGPDPSLEEPLGRGGERLHEWAFATRGFRQRQGMGGGEEGPDSHLVEETTRRTGATVMGRHMFSGGSGPWEDDPNAQAWWGDDPPFHHPVFVLTHHPREPLVKEGGTTFTFVTEGVEAAVEQARAAAGGRHVAVGGGGSVARQVLRAGLLDDFLVHVVPVLLGDGVRLFGPDAVAEVECMSVLRSPTGVVHLRYRVVR